MIGPKPSQQNPRRHQSKLHYSQFNREQLIALFNNRSIPRGDHDVLPESEKLKESE